MLVSTGFLPPSIPFLLPQTPFDSPSSLLVYKQKFSISFMKSQFKNLLRSEILWFQIANLIRNQFNFDHMILRYVRIYLKIFKIFWCVSRGILVILRFFLKISKLSFWVSSTPFFIIFLSKFFSYWISSLILIFFLKILITWVYLKFNS